MALPTTTISRDMFLRLPPAAAVVLLSTVLGGLVDGYALLPRQTKTIEPHELNVIMWPPLPTAAPLLSPLELFRRQTDNTICGYLGGDSALPATCSAGSHCVLDKANKVMGCCPNSGSCTTGVFTGCVDQNSGPQTEENPYVYTCTGSNVCYKNSFPGGVFQYGCGTASDLATSVQTGASGKPTLPLIQTSISLTQSPSSLSQSSSSQSASSSSTSTSAESSSSTSEASSSSSGTPTSSANPANSTPAAPPTSNTSGPGYNRTGAIVGGTIGGLALLAALLVLLFCCLRRRRNKRQGPGPGPDAAPTSEYVSVSTQSEVCFANRAQPHAWACTPGSLPIAVQYADLLILKTSPVRNHGAAFAPLPTWQEEEEPQITPPPRHNQPYYQYEHPPTAAAGNMTHPANAVSGPSPNTPIGGDGGGGWPLAYGAARAPDGGRVQTPIANDGAGAVVTPLTPYHSDNPHALSNDWTHQGHDNTMTHSSHGPPRDIDDFSRDVTATMRHVSDSDTEPLTAGSSMHNYPIEGPGTTTGPHGDNNNANPNMLQPYQNRQLGPGSSGSMTSSSSYTPSRRGDRPLWQQTRRQSRNQVWL
ncbi:hypothetical protein PG997_007383 [Apiospora hydei]|uniref:Uncharacterized protein n=1 Tax=Apiospora hydei TaxID=1337664 RepID=A0ABR1WAR8_9PEZI